MLELYLIFVTNVVKYLSDICHKYQLGGKIDHAKNKFSESHNRDHPDFGGRSLCPSIHFSDKKGLHPIFRNVFIANLAVSDLCLCVVTMPLTLIEVMNSYHQNTLFTEEFIGFPTNKFCELWLYKDEFRLL